MYCGPLISYSPSDTIAAGNLNGPDAEPKPLS